MITVRKRVPRQNLQRFAAGGGVSPTMFSEGTGDPMAPGYNPSTPSSNPATPSGYGIPPVAQPVSAGNTSSNNYVSSPATSSPSITKGTYAPAAQPVGGISASAQGLPPARPATGYTPGPQANKFGSWGSAVEGGGYNSVPGNPAVPTAIPTNTYQRASTRGTYGSYTDQATLPGSPSQPVLPSAPKNMLAGTNTEQPDQPVIPYSSFYTGAGKQMRWGPEQPGNPMREGNVSQWAGMAKRGGAIPQAATGGGALAALDTGGAVPDPIPDTDPGEQTPTNQGGGGGYGASDPMQNVRAALTSARQQNGLNDQVFQQLWNMNVGGQQAANPPTVPAGPGGDQPSNNPFPTKTPAVPFGRMSSNDNDADDQPSAAGGGAIPYQLGGQYDMTGGEQQSGEDLDEGSDTTEGAAVAKGKGGGAPKMPKPGKGGGGGGGGGGPPSSDPQPAIPDPTGGMMGGMGGGGGGFSG